MIGNYNGLTVPELIEFLLSLPKAEHEDDIGEVWVRNDRNNPFINNLCYTASKLNKNDVLLGMDSRIADPAGTDQFDDGCSTEGLGLDDPDWDPEFKHEGGRWETIKDAGLDESCEKFRKENDE